MLKLPPTIRGLQGPEITNDPELHERLSALENANISEGYVLHQNMSHDIPFSFVAEINVDNPKLWQLFRSLAVQFPDTMCCVYNLYGEGPVHTPYVDKTVLLSYLDDYQLELTQCCDLEFGIVHQSEDRFLEVFIPDSKYLTVWGSNELAFRELMENSQLGYTRDLAFIDEFPHVHISLSFFEDTARKASDVLNEIAHFCDLMQVDMP